MDHSVRGYLRRRSDEELKAALWYCLQRDDELHQEYVALILQILEERFLQAGEPSDGK